jgi:hypothetical protein
MAVDDTVMPSWPAENDLARITSQIKGVASLLLATSASICFGFASRRWDNAGGHWAPFAIGGFGCLLGQLALLFLESREEAFFSLHRRLEDLKVQESISETENRVAELKAASVAIQGMLRSGKLEEAEKTDAVRRNLHGR